MPQKPKQPSDFLKFRCTKCNEPLKEEMQQEGIVDPWLYYATVSCFICNTYMFVTSYFNRKTGKVQYEDGKLIDIVCEWARE
jgi:hypothetical protein